MEIKFVSHFSVSSRSLRLNPLMNWKQFEKNGTSKEDVVGREEICAHCEGREEDVVGGEETCAHSEAREVDVVGGETICAHRKAREEDVVGGGSFVHTVRSARRT
jgi:hypothetical protein